MNNLEIEHKYLVKSDAYKSIAFSQTMIKQGYLSTDPERTVRIRIKGDEAYLTVKGITRHGGTTRFEWERSIPYADALQMLVLCKPYLIEKTRYCVQFNEYVVEVDEFHNENAGLIFAEIELPNADTQLNALPIWLGKEVTGISLFYNSNLISHPYSKWTKAEQSVLE